MPNARPITLTTGTIQRNIIKLNKIINELDYYRRGIGCKYRRKHFLEDKQSYCTQVLERSNSEDGVPCFKCNAMIEPYTNCMAKYHHTNLAPIVLYYHNACWDELYH